MPKITPFSIIIDTREQLPYQFNDEYYTNHGLLAIVRKKLDYGDYTIEGLESIISIERKQLSEYFLCMGTDRKRFEREIEGATAKGIHIFCLVEGSNAYQDNVEVMLDIHSRLNLNSLHASETAWMLRYKYNVIYCGNRQASEKRCFNTLLHVFKNKEKYEKI